jgi:hypothetical protein
MMIVKNRTSAGGWLTYAEPRGISKYLFLNENSAETDVSVGMISFSQQVQQQQISQSTVDLV